jgi:hypothetical protein
MLDAFPVAKIHIIQRNHHLLIMVRNLLQVPKFPLYHRFIRQNITHLDVFSFIILFRYENIFLLPPAARGTLLEKTAPLDREASAKTFY